MASGGASSRRRAERTRSAWTGRGARLRARALEFADILRLANVLSRATVTRWWPRATADDHDARALWCKNMGQ